MISSSHRVLAQNVFRGVLRPSPGIDARRLYHATQRREILPILAGIGVLVIARYSWKAMRRMSEEEEEYQWLLQQYERRHGSVVARENQKYPDGTMAVDVGTFYVKLAKDKSVIVNREGSRLNFAGIVRKDGEDDLVGQRALQKFYEVQKANPDLVALTGNDASVIPAVLQPVLHDALESTNASLNKLHMVVTVPPLKWEAYQYAFSQVLPQATMVPEPVAAVWGAQLQKSLPDILETPVLVIDVGGTETHLSVVQKNVITSTTTLDNISGDLFVQALVDHVSTEQIQNDGMALQRVYQAAHSAVAELNAKTHAEIHIPYISMDLETRQPQHLDMRVARSVIDHKVTDKILSTIDKNKLSQHMPPPTTLSLYWMSVLTQLLEVSHLTPLQVSHFLVVGGGSKHGLIETSLRDCLVALQGKSDNLVLPQERSEVMALGASSMLFNYRYDTQSGLLRENE